MGGQADRPRRRASAANPKHREHVRGVVHLTTFAIESVLSSAESRYQSKLNDGSNSRRWVGGRGSGSGYAPFQLSFARGLNLNFDPTVIPFNSSLKSTSTQDHSRRHSHASRPGPCLALRLPLEGRLLSVRTSSSARASRSQPVRASSVGQAQTLPLRLASGSASNCVYIGLHQTGKSHGGR